MDLHLSTYLLFTLLIFFSFLIVQKRKRANNNQSSVPKLPPGPWKLPVLGSLHHLLGSPLPHHSLRDLSRRHGPLMHLQLGEVSTVVVSSPEAAKEILKTHGLNFATRPEIQSMKLCSYGFKDIIMGPYGANWRQLRRICQSELLSAKRVESLRFIMEEETSNLTQTISMSVNHPVNLSKLASAAINNMTARAAFGDRSKYQEVFLAAMREGLQLVGGFSVADLFPSCKMLPVITGMKSKVEELHLKLDGIFSDIIEEHRMKYETGKKKLDESYEDLVDVLLRLQGDGDLEIPISDDCIKAVILDVFVAGTESASNMLLWAMSELMRTPDTLAKAQEEVRRVLKGMKTISDTNFQQLNYLKSVIKETLRLHPPGPLLIPRECRQSCEINGYLIPAGTRVLTNAWAIARDAQYWGDDSESFRPERFLNNPVDFMGANFEFIPFGAGRRMCPGITYGLASVELPLAQLLHDFNWELPDGMEPKELDMTEQFGAAVARRTDLCLVPLPYDI
ncbi:premnaspirodiene oxygenase-like [Aristolochia californica]|uniref:premnaspirodiene oxygenase-like n=1 Tax=Aristolochia californica TaxID=171875 RepID=UPI0035DA3FB3